MIMSSSLEQKTFTLLLVGKPGHMRDALAGLLESMTAIGTISCADSGLMALKAVRENRPTLVLVSGLPDTETPELIRQIKQRWPQTLCLAQVEMPQQQRQALFAGADYVLPGSIAGPELRSTIHNILLKDGPTLPHA